MSSETIVPAIQDATRQPGFIDLRAFVAEVAGSIPQNDADAFTANRVVLVNASGKTPVAALALTGEGSIAAQATDEFLFVVSGMLTLTEGEQSHTLSADDAVVIPQGAAFQWTADSAVAVTLTYADSKAEGRAITPISKTPDLQPSGKPDPKVLLGPAPDCRNHNDYRVDDGRFSVGTWDSTPYKRTGYLYGHYEIMFIVEGSVTFGDDQTRCAQSFGTGSLVLAEAGGYTSWDNPEHVAKIFAIYRT